MLRKTPAELLLAAALLSLVVRPVSAQDEPEPPPPAETASAKLGERFYLSPLGSYTLTEKARSTDDGIGGSVAIGKQLNTYFSVELSAQRSEFDPASLSGLGLNTLFFPARASFYGLVGAAYGKVKDQPGNVANYDAALLQLGAGWLFKPFNLLGQDFFVRSEAVYRLDAHNDRRTGPSTGNGRKAFNDVVFGLGLVLPLGKVPAPVEPPPPEPEVVEVVAVEPEPAPVEAAPAVAETPPCAAPKAGSAISLLGCAVGDSLVLSGVYFATDQAVLMPDAKAILDGVVDALLARPDVQVELGGHTDSDASEAYNQNLSDRRAKAVVDYIASKGVDAGRLSSKGYGEASPIADNASADGKALNRRVEVKVVAVVAEAAAPATAAAEPAADAAEAPAAESAAEPTAEPTDEPTDEPNAETPSEPAPTP